MSELNKSCESNNFEFIDNSLSEIISLLIENSDDLWKCLKYTSPNALSLPITQQDKLDLIKQNTDDNRLILRMYNRDIIDKSRVELRIFMSGFTGRGIMDKRVRIGFQIIVYNDLWLLDNTKTRANVMLHEIFKILELAMIDNLAGDLRFEGNTGTIVAFNESYQGYDFEMSSGMS